MIEELGHPKREFLIDSLFGLVFLAGLVAVMISMNGWIIAFEGGVMFGYLIRVWERMVNYENVLQEAVVETAEEEVEETVETEIAQEAEKQVAREAEEQVAKEAEEQVAEEMLEVLQLAENGVTSDELQEVVQQAVTDALERHSEKISSEEASCPLDGYETSSN